MRKDYITIKFMALLSLVLFIIFLPYVEYFQVAANEMIEPEWLRVSLTGLASFSGLIIFAWLAPKTAKITEE